MTDPLNDSKIDIKARTPEIQPDELVKEEILGEGSFGIVWKGSCRGKSVAIKELSTELDDKTIREFKKECEILIMLRHANIVTFMGACVDRNNLAFVTELLDGDLDDFIKSGRKISLVQKLKMCRDIAQGMAWLHKSTPQIIHRDLKPKNILMDSHLNVKICDFGLSIMLEKKETINTRAGSFIWMAPEALEKKPHNEKVDVYSYGIVCWQILTNSPQPYQEYLELGSLDAFVDAVCKRQERPPLGELPKCVKDLVKRLWSQDPASRPDFETIIYGLNSCMLEVTLIYPEARDFWKFYFDGKTEVLFHNFAQNLFEHLSVNPDEDQKKMKCLDSILTKDDPSRFVTLERFGYILKWFGPLSFGETNIIDKIHSIMRNKWFHGEVSRDQINQYSTQFENEKKKKQFLVRFSETEPIEEHPFSITVFNGSQNTSYRINYDVDTAEYSVTHKTKNSKESQTQTDGDLSFLLNIKLKKALKLRNDIIGKYFIIFQETNTNTADIVYVLEKN